MDTLKRSTHQLYFDLLKEILFIDSLTIKCRQIYNCDKISLSKRWRKNRHSIAILNQKTPHLLNQVTHINAHLKKKSFSITSTQSVFPPVTQPYSAGYY